MDGGHVAVSWNKPWGSDGFCAERQSFRWYSAHAHWFCRGSYGGGFFLEPITACIGRCGEYGQSVLFVGKVLNLCQAWNIDRSLNIAVELYEYLDGEEQSLALYEEAEDDTKMNALWNCMIDSVAYVCRGAFEEQGAKWFPEPIELVDESLFVHLEEALLQFSGSRVEFDRIVSDCSGS